MLQGSVGERKYNPLKKPSQVFSRGSNIVCIAADSETGLALPQMFLIFDCRMILSGLCENEVTAY